jgi:hypothetical protein
MATLVLWQAPPVVANSQDAGSRDECLTDLPEWLQSLDYRFQGHVRVLEPGRFRMVDVDGLALPLPDEAVVEVRGAGRSLGIQGQTYEASVMRIDGSQLTANVATMGDGYRIDATLVGQAIQYLGHVDRNCPVPKRFYTAALTLVALLDPQGAERVDVRIARDVPGLLIVRHFPGPRLTMELVVDDPASADGWVAVAIHAAEPMRLLRDF